MALRDGIEDAVYCKMWQIAFPSYPLRQEAKDHATERNKDKWYGRYCTTLQRYQTTSKQKWTGMEQFQSQQMMLVS
jgi:hypothetical protein